MNLVKTCLLISLFIGAAATNAAQPLVIFLSWDGMRHDFPDLASFPSLERLEREGIRAGALVPGYPSNTFPGHVTLATGAEPKVHGILDNKFLDRKKGTYAYSSDADWIDAEPLWITTERQGIKSATYFWVGSESDWHGQASSYRMAPFDGGRPETEKVDKIIQWIDLDERERPQLIMSYWRGADTTAHIYGPSHSNVPEVIATQDEQLGRLLTAIDDRKLWDSTTLILVSDHGMTETYKSAEIETVLEDSELKTQVFGGGSLKHVFVEQPDDIDAVYALLSKQPDVKIYKKHNLPESFQFAHPDRTGDIIVTVEPPFTLARPSSLKDRAINMAVRLLGRFTGHSAGSHGYDPNLPDMQGIFYAMGHGVDASKSLGKVHQLDVASTITTLLGIEPPLQSSGTPIPLH